MFLWYMQWSSDTSQMTGQAERDGGQPAPGFRPFTTTGPGPRGLPRHTTPAGDSISQKRTGFSCPTRIPLL